MYFAEIEKNSLINKSRTQLTQMVPLLTTDNGNNWNVSKY